MRILEDFGRKLGRENVRFDVSQCMIIHMQIYTRYFNMQGMKPGNLGVYVDACLSWSCCSNSSSPSVTSIS